MAVKWQVSRFDIDLTQPRVMGIVNVTPDSFSDGGLRSGLTEIMQHAERLLKEGGQRQIGQCHAGGHALLGGLGTDTGQIIPGARRGGLGHQALQIGEVIGAMGECGFEHRITINRRGVG